MFTDKQLFAAPLAGITDKPFRRLIRSFSPKSPILTEMISCHSLVEGHKNCLRNFDRYEDEGLIGAQIFGASPTLMAESAKILQDLGAKWIDINMGCPVPKVATKAGAGAFLMQDHKLACKIMGQVVKAVNIPVSIKTRLGWDEKSKNWQDLVKIAVDCGISFVTLHGRTRAQLYNGPAQMPEKPDLPIPIIANGDIKTSSDIEKVQNLGYDGAMIGRALFGKPLLIGCLLGSCKEPDNIGELVLKHLNYAIEYYGEKTAVPMFRKHAAWYSAGLPNSAGFRIKVNQINNANDLKMAICEFWGCELD